MPDIMIDNYASKETVFTRHLKPVKVGSVLMFSGREFQVLHNVTNISDYFFRFIFFLPYYW